MEKSIQIKDWIGIYDGFILPSECDKAIKIFEQENEFKNTFSRMTSENTGPNKKNDLQLFCNPANITLWHKDLKVMIANFDIALKNYLMQTDITNLIGNLSYEVIKIQKTIPGQGYHLWHVEHSPGLVNTKRFLVYTIYLNDVDDGGETEFLHFSRRVKPKKGRIVIWPASFPYVHRGNPPLKGEKYIVTSWLSLPNDN
jgi:hypothetical protein